MDLKRRINLRIIFLALTAILMFLTMTVRLWWIQTVDAAYIMGKAKWDWEKTLKPKRGAILDRNGEYLAF